MKSQKFLLGLCVALLIISEAFLISANRQKSEATAQLRQAQLQVADLQSQLAQATNSLTTDDASELARLRADIQDIPRLRNEILQLQTQNTNLTQMLIVMRQAGQSVQQQLQESEAENEQAAEDQQAQAEAVRRIVARQRNECIANLRLIYVAKQAWALEKNKADTDTPTEQDLLPYIKGGVFPVCPAGGTYSIGPVGQLPTCSIPGHVLPSQ
ncbi:MAG: hypothetical protein ACREE6_13845 [Limisphaerales bacterium]